MDFYVHPTDFGPDEDNLRWRDRAIDRYEAYLIASGCKPTERWYGQMRHTFDPMSRTFLRELLIPRLVLWRGLGKELEGEDNGAVQTTFNNRDFDAVRAWLRDEIEKYSLGDRPQSPPVWMLRLYSGLMGAL